MIKVEKSSNFCSCDSCGSLDRVNDLYYKRDVSNMSIVLHLCSRCLIDTVNLVCTAKWISGSGKSNIWYCSHCGDKINYNPNTRCYNIVKKPVHEVNKHCRNCGFKMIGYEIASVVK